MADKIKRIKSAGSKVGRQHANHEMKYKRQFFRTSRNKVKRIQRHLSFNPNDEVSKEALKRAQGL